MRPWSNNFKDRARDLAPTNALLAKAVERCAEKGIPYLAYAIGSRTVSANSKGTMVSKIRSAQIFVPLTRKGKLALHLGLHRGWKAAIPDAIKGPLKKLRKFWHGFGGK